MKKEEDGTKTRIRKTKGMGSLLSQVLLPTECRMGKNALTANNLL